MKFKHGQYFWDSEKGYFLFNSYLKKGRAFLITGKVLDISFETHPKLIRGIVERGEWISNQGRYGIGCIK